MEIVGFRMRSGEDIVAEKVSETETEINVRRPLVPVAIPERDPMTGRPAQNGKETLSFLAWLPFAVREEVHVVPKEIVAVVYAPVKEIQDFYLQATSGIALPKQGLLHG